ncbi:WD40 repeat domain-containing serine/threonine protein kinase [Actinomadura gamaensis]|uniref:WD40 repeat domain-containing serine/threonine protein kinase n=1 Tax=Actinomadura gamaensis TaxID=1763541 RepID=A0ABV9TYZ7_9ACTN
MEPLRPGDPRQIGPHRLEARLGSGGMGRVFLGASPGGRRVAVKVIEAAHAEDPRYRRRFAREIDAARRVGGFHTAPVVDADPDAPEPWLATAFIPGPSLREVVAARGPLGRDDLRALAAGLAEGLTAIHGHGLVHRDLKPENVIMAADGPRIIDFGVARAADATSLTSAGVVVGTYAFMAPEQVLGGAAGPPADVFSFGCLLAFAATGKGPFDAGTIPAIVHRVLNDAPELEAVPDVLRTLVSVCLAKDPAARPTVRQVLDHLTDPDAGALPKPSLAALLSAPSVEPETLDDHAAANEPTHPAATMVATRQYAPPPVPLTPPVDVRRRALLIGGGAAVAAAAIGVPAALLLTGSDGEKAPAKKSSRLVSFVSPVKTLSGHTQGVRNIAFSPDGRYLASGSDDSTVIIWDVAAGNAARTLRGHTSSVLGVAFSPDGRTVASAALDRTVRLWDAGTGTLRRTLPTEQFGPLSLAFSPDGRFLAGCNPDIWIWDAASGRKLRTLTGSGNAGMDDVAFSPDGRTVAAVTDGFYKRAPGSSVLMYDPATGRRTRTLVGHKDSVRALAFLPDDRTCASGGNEGIVRIWDFPAGRTTATITVGGGVIRSLAVTPDGRTLATGNSDRTVRLFDLATRAPAGTLTGPASGIESVKVSPDGSLIAAGSGEGSTADPAVYLWKAR